MAEMQVNLKPCHTRVASLQYSHSTPKNTGSPRCVLSSPKQSCVFCANAENAMWGDHLKYAQRQRRVCTALFGLVERQRYARCADAV